MYFMARIYSSTYHYLMHSFELANFLATASPRLKPELMVPIGWIMSSVEDVKWKNNLTFRYKKYFNYKA